MNSLSDFHSVGAKPTMSVGIRIIFQENRSVSVNKNSGEAIFITIVVL